MRTSNYANGAENPKSGPSSLIHKLQKLDSYTIMTAAVVHSRAPPFHDINGLILNKNSETRENKW